MADAASEPRTGQVAFTGSRHELLGILVRGYALMLPTLGLYRFWQATWKRRFYWQNTVIDGEPLEYTGNATQLLFGFFFALAFFLPIYLALFVLSMQDGDLLVVGYLGAAAIVWFLAGYAIYRARDFRLSRTLWRGIRFDQRGNAWAYATRRFLWSVPLVITLGLVYPWMASSLWKYRWRNSWYGDRKFDIAGNWRAFAAPFYATYFLNVLTIGAAAGWIGVAHDYGLVGNVPIPGPLGSLAVVGSVIVLALSLAWYRTRSASRMLSTVSLGEAKLAVNLRAGALFGQQAAYVAGLLAVLVLLGIALVVIIGFIYAAASTDGGEPSVTALVSLFQSGTTNVILLILAYLVVLGLLGLLAEIVLAFGWWKLLIRGTSIVNPDSLRTVRAAPEDRSLIGQGLADALNVGAY